MVIKDMLFQITMAFWFRGVLGYIQITTVFVFLVVVNAINFIDGIDGLAISQFIKSIIIIELFSQN